MDNHCKLLVIHQLKQADIAWFQIIVIDKLPPALSKPTTVVSDLDFSLPCISLVGMHKVHSGMPVPKVFSTILWRESLIAFRNVRLSDNIASLKNKQQYNQKNTLHQSKENIPYSTIRFMTILSILTLKSDGKKSLQMKFTLNRAVMTHHIAIVFSNIARFHDVHKNGIWRSNSLNFVFYFIHLLIC